MGFGFTDWLEEKPEEDLVEEPENKPSKRRSTALTTRVKNTIYRRAFSETQLLDISPKTFEDGMTVNYLTAGDVDALSFLKLMIRQQDIDHCLFSTWCMAGDDVLQLEEWLESGKIKTLDAYVGEIFPSSYRHEYARLKEIIPRHGGRMAVFRNHSKTFAGIGPKFAFGIQTSANINTNPRAENGSITISHEIYEFYRSYYSGIKSIVK